MAELKVQVTDPEERGPTERDLLVEIRGTVQHLLEISSAGRPGTHEALHVLEEMLLDSLTRLANRRAFAQRASELAGAGTPYVIGSLALDDFKKVNDAFGHVVGDQLLVVIGSAIKEQLPAADIVARLGGDEFAVIFRGTPPDAVANALTLLIAALPGYAAKASPPPVTASAGVSSDHVEPIEMKPRDADRAMYQAKEEGRARVKLAE